MNFFERIDRHSELFQRMAEASGTDLADAVAFGRLNPNELSGAVWSCLACSKPDECREWLDTHETGSPPSYCRNRNLLTRLAN